MLVIPAKSMCLAVSTSPFPSKGSLLGSLQGVNYTSRDQSSPCVQNSVLSSMSQHCHSCHHSPASKPTWHSPVPLTKRASPPSSSVCDPAPCTSSGASVHRQERPFPNSNLCSPWLVPLPLCILYTSFYRNELCFGPSLVGALFLLCTARLPGD